MARSSTGEVLRAHCAAIAQEESALREAGGKAGHERQRKMGRLPLRERLRHIFSSKKLCIKAEFVEMVDPILRTKSNAFGCVMCGPPHTA